MKKTSRGSKKTKKDDLEEGNGKFTIETGKSISAITRRVKEMAKQGWKPLGGASFFFTNKGTPAFAQSLERTDSTQDYFDYAIQTGKTLSALSERVNTKMKEGSTPVGSGFVFRNDDGDLIYCQTLISR